MMIQIKLDQLVEECKSRGIDPPLFEQKNGTKKYRKKDLIRALQTYSCEQRYPDGKIPEHLRRILTYESPMLCERFHNCKPELQDEIWTSNEWVFEEKWNGIRMILVYVRNEGLHFYSRGLSVKDFLPIEYTGIWLGDGVEDVLFEAFKTLEIGAFEIDSECMSGNPNISTVMGNRGVITETPLQAVEALLALNDEESLRIQKDLDCPLFFAFFDVPALERERGIAAFGKNEPYKIRRSLVVKMSNLFTAASAYVKVSPLVSGKEAKKVFYEEILSRAGEGCVAKHLEGDYRDTDSRAHRLAVKIKRSVSEAASLEVGKDTIDAFISGFLPGTEGTANENKVGAIRCSVLLQGPDGQTEHEIARISGLTDDLREDMTIFQDGELSLNPKYERMVVEIDGQAVSARAKRLTHAVLKRVRNDKAWFECDMDQEFLDSLIV